MQSIAILILFIGLFVVTHSIYEEKLRLHKRESTRVEYRFIPRTYLEEQHANKNLTGMYQNMFEDSTSWKTDRGNDSEMMTVSGR